MCALTEPVESTLPQDPRAPKQARDFVERATCRAHHANVLDDAKLLVSELVTNAVEHGSPPITVRIECDGTEGMKVSVGDHSTAPVVPRTATELDENGRGLALVHVISSAWGIEAQEDGKQVWFSIRADNPTVAYTT